jgi:hypothetical protein
LILTLTLTRKFFELPQKSFELSRKFFELSEPRWRNPYEIAPAHHQTVFEPPFMTSIGPPLAFMNADSGTRWLPEPRTFGSKSGRVLCRPYGQPAGHQPAIPSVGIQMVGEPYPGVESSVD